ncbi:hypothetical protein KFL_000200440 [Klebsormidium nitens]|uniref:Glycosyl transferase CAP10 domain-containing protein n=1 Tax=Klebsormidium nitens TaxID=105231 RepID=A0A1Y1HMH0_KLENI|nr:hypothetical protein KFL_000200440 [Klebsormidium nitens]|eukprot:GAQ78892.1 hypothetical protein KFL_000200440 [Klebsormidium nitens]
MPSNPSKEEVAGLLAPPSYERSILAPLSLEGPDVVVQKKSSYSRYLVLAGAFLLSAIICLAIFSSASAELSATILPSELSGKLQDWKQSLRARNVTLPEESDGEDGDMRNCPAWFSSLREDFKPWSDKGGITIQDVEAAQPIAASRFQILNGSLYMENFHHCFQSRLRYSLWGLLMLLRKYPGSIPDVDFMWDCGDDPKAFRPADPGDPIPFLFNFCKLAHSIDVPFPDWSFWGWPELQILPWQNQSVKIAQGGADAGAWRQRKPTAFWKGNVWVGYGLTQNLRLELTDCRRDPVWEVEAYGQDWGAEVANGFQYSRQWQQCGWRYKVYAEGNAWSVSSKYGFACGSTMLVIEPYFEAFYSRGMAYGHNCLFVRRRPLCEALKEQIDWGNEHETEAEAIGQAGQKWILEDVRMEHVYEYMLHLLQTYAALQTFTPARSSGARLVTEADILSEAPPHEVSEYLLQETVATRPLCKLVDEKVGASIEGGRKLSQVQAALRAGRFGRERANQVELVSERDGKAGTNRRSRAWHMLESTWLSWLRTLDDNISRFFGKQNLRT